MPSYDGNSALFGRSVAVTMIPHESAEQLSAFWGLSGVLRAWGGGRGRMFEVRGVLYGSDFANLWTAISTLLSYDDGIARTLVDTAGNSWPQVIFTGRWKPEDQYRYAPDGVYLAYTALFRGLL